MFPKVSFLLCIALLPCLLASEAKMISCPDGIECPFGKTCCEPEQPNGPYQCCDLSKEESLNKKLVPGLKSFSTFSPPAEGVEEFSNCSGTVCHTSTCCQDIKSAVCCDTSDFCCPNSTRCCGENDTNWCCMSNQRCHAKHGYCIAGAATFSSATLCLLFILLLTTSKYFF